MNFKIIIAVVAVSLPLWSRSLRDQEDMYFSLATESESKEGCGPETCKSFEVTAACSCRAYLSQQPALVRNVNAALTDFMQVLRRVADKVTPQSWAVEKIWYANMLGNAERKLHFVMEAAGAADPQVPEIADPQVPEIATLLGTVVADVDHANYDIPAGVLPIMVEIWDKQGVSVRGDTFIGEAGLPLTPTPSKETFLDLRPNAHHTHHVKQPGDAKVHVRYHIEVEEVPCSAVRDSPPCVSISATVECIAASNLPNTDILIPYDLTDPFCKIRVGETPGSSSVKHTTAFVQDNLNPTFDVRSNTLKHQWETEMMQRGVGRDGRPVWVPRTLDQMTMIQQAEITTHVLVRDVFGYKKMCSGDKIKDSIAQACIQMRMIEVERGDVNTSARKQATREMEDTVEGVADSGKLDQNVALLEVLNGAVPDEQVQPTDNASGPPQTEAEEDLAEAALKKEMNLQLTLSTVLFFVGFALALILIAL